MKRVTIRDVADRSGVSLSTVSNVLNGRTDQMSAETLRRVTEVIATLGYRPSGLARGLVTGRTSTIGLVVDEINTSLFIGAVSAAEPLVRKGGYSLLLGHPSDARSDREVVGLLLEKGVEGVMLISTSQYGREGALAALRAAAAPAVVVNRPGRDPGFGRVSWDNCGGVMMAVHHLYQLGHRRIAHLQGPPDRFSTDERVRGYRLGLEQCGLEVVEQYLQPSDFTKSRDTWEAAALRLLEVRPPVTALIAADDEVAAVVMKTLQRQGLRIPEDMAVVGIDDQTFAPLLSPALTTIRLPVAEAMKTACEMLLLHLQGRCENWPDITLPTSLIVRESCGAMAGGGGSRRQATPRPPDTPAQNLLA